MVRELDIGWSHGTPVDGNKQHSQCNYCDKVIKGGGVSRLKRHLAGVAGDVEKCVKCPDEVRELMVDVLRTGKEKTAEKEKTIEKYAKDDALRDQIVEYNPEFQGGSASESKLMCVEDNMKGDKLILRGLKFHGYHGVKPEERTLGQKFLVDVDAWVDLHEAGVSDNLSDTISYTEIYRIVRDVVEGPAQNLLETLAHSIATTTLTEFSRISSVRVKVGKPHIAVEGIVDYLGVEILRHRSIDV